MDGMDRFQPAPLPGMGYRANPPQRPGFEYQPIGPTLESIFNAYMQMRTANAREQMLGMEQQKMGIEMQGAQRQQALQNVQDTATYGAPISSFSPQDLQRASVTNAGMVNPEAQGPVQMDPRLQKLSQAMSELGQQRQMGQAGQMADLTEKMSESRLKNAQAGFYEAGMKPGSVPAQGMDVDSAAKAVIEGRAIPSDFPGFGSNSMKARVLAKVYQMNPDYDAGKATVQRRFQTGEASFASSSQVQTPITYMKSVIPNIEHLKEVSRELPRGGPMLYNRAKLTAMRAMGDPQVAAYDAVVTEVGDQIAKILQGGGTGSGTSDAKLKQAMELFDKGYTPEQLDSVLGEIGNLLQNRVGALEGVQGKFKSASEGLVYTKTATNPKTGEKMGFRGGKWEKIP